MDSLNFITPTKVGDVVTIRSIVSRTYTSSMEVYVTVESGRLIFFMNKKRMFSSNDNFLENLQTTETTFTNDGFFTIGKYCMKELIFVSHYCLFI